MGCIISKASGKKNCREEGCTARHGIACCLACGSGKGGSCNHVCEYIQRLWDEQKKRKGK